MVDRLILYLRIVGMLCLLGTALPCAARLADGDWAETSMPIVPPAQWKTAGAAPESGVKSATFTATGTRRTRQGLDATGKAVQLANSSSISLAGAQTAGCGAVSGDLEAANGFVVAPFYIAAIALFYLDRG